MIGELPASANRRKSKSSVLFQFCPLNCKRCYVPHLHDAAGGVSISIKRLADLLLDENFERDGVTILGGEPFAQSDGLLALVRELRLKNCSHIVFYSGYTLEALREKSLKQPSIGAVLGEIDVLIDGAYNDRFHRARDCGRAAATSA